MSHSTFPSPLYPLYPLTMKGEANPRFLHLLKSLGLSWKPEDTVKTIRDTVDRLFFEKNLACHQTGNYSALKHSIDDDQAHNFLKEVYRDRVQILPQENRADAALLVAGVAPTTKLRVHALAQAVLSGHSYGSLFVLCPNQETQQVAKTALKNVQEELEEKGKQLPSITYIGGENSETFLNTKQLFERVQEQLKEKSYVLLSDWHFCHSHNLTAQMNLDPSSRFLGVARAEACDWEKEIADFGYNENVDTLEESPKVRRTRFILNVLARTLFIESQWEQTLPKNIPDASSSIMSF